MSNFLTRKGGSFCRYNKKYMAVAVILADKYVK